MLYDKWWKTQGGSSQSKLVCPNIEAESSKGRKLDPFRLITNTPGVFEYQLEYRDFLRNKLKLSMLHVFLDQEN